MFRAILLAFDFTKRDLKERYFGTSLGQLWYVLSPIVTIFIYTVIFSDFMKMKIGIVNSNYSYSIYLVPGILAWTSFSTVISRLSTSILEKANLIKKLNVPMFVFYLSILFSEVILLGISFALALLFLIIIGHPITLSFVWLFIVLGFQFIFSFSLGVILSLFVPFFKDLKEVIPIVLQLWFWMTPIVYLKDMIAKKYPILIDINPAYMFIEVYQDIFLYGTSTKVYENFLPIVMLSAIVFVVAVYLYKKLMPEIKDIV